MCAVLLLVVAWPTFHQKSYNKWRTPAVSVLRLFLFALPFNFDTNVFDAIAPTVATGRLALVANIFQLFMGRLQAPWLVPCEVPCVEVAVCA